MKMIKQSHRIFKFPYNALRHIEDAARTCKQSRGRETEESAISMCKRLLKDGHFAMFEFADMTVDFITNRGVTHELVRHRIVSYAQESTRYVAYDDDVVFIEPVWGDNVREEDRDIFVAACSAAERAYKLLRDAGWDAQQAREVLPHALKTEIRVKTNIREWRHIFSLRCARDAHPQIRELMLGLLRHVANIQPILFADLLQAYDV